MFEYQKALITLYKPISNFYEFSVETHELIQLLYREAGFKGVIQFLV